MTEIKELELSDGSIGYDLRITPEIESQSLNDHREIAIACTSEEQAKQLKILLDQAVSIELM